MFIIAISPSAKRVEAENKTMVEKNPRGSVQEGNVQDKNDASERMRKLLEIKEEMEREVHMKKERLEKIKTERERRQKLREIKQSLRKRERTSKSSPSKLQAKPLAIDAVNKDVTRKEPMLMRKEPMPKTANKIEDSGEINAFNYWINLSPSPRLELLQGRYLYILACLAGCKIPYVSQNANDLDFVTISYVSTFFRIGLL